MRLRTSALAALAALLFAAPAAQAHAGHKPKRRTVDVQLLALNDFHGSLEATQTFTVGPNAATDRIPTGGIEYLSGLVQAKRQAQPGTLVVSAGDLIGASPLLSASFHDEPTIEAMNILGLDANAVGNHEFDEGSAELLRMQDGGCHPVDGCQDGDGFAGADFPFLAANVVREDTGRTLFPAYVIKRVKGVRIGFIGLTLKETPTIVTPSGVAGLQFLDETQSINAAARQLHKRHVRSIVVLIHQGGNHTGFGINDCMGVDDPIRSIVQHTTQAVDLFISGHTHQPYNCNFDGRPVVSSSSFGRVLNDIDMRIDRRSGETKQITAANQLVLRREGIDPKDPRETELLTKYQTLVAPIANRVIGSTAAALTRTPTPAGETPLGDVIADAQLAATSPAGFGSAVAAFMNPGGIRADIDAGDVTYAEAFTVQPFGNSLVTLTLTGAQTERMLEQQWDGQGTSPKVLQVSNGFSYTWNPAAAVGDRVDPASITIGGVAVDPAASYRVTVNSFLADGGDNFTVLREGTDRLGGAVDLDAFEAYLKASSPLAPPAGGRILTTP